MAQQGLLIALLVAVDTCALLRERGQPVRSFKRARHTAEATLRSAKSKNCAATSQLGSNGFAEYIEGAVRYIAAALQSRRCFAAQAPDVLSNRGLICASTSPSVLGGRLGTYVAQVVHLIRPSSFGR